LSALPAASDKCNGAGQLIVVAPGVAAGCEDVIPLAMNCGTSLGSWGEIVEKKKQEE